MNSKLSKWIEYLFPKGVSYALIKVEQHCNWRDIHVVYNQGNFYVGGKDFGRNATNHIVGGIKVSDIEDVTRIEVLAIGWEGIFFDIKDEWFTLLDYDEDEVGALADNCLRYWPQLTDKANFNASRLHTDLEWIVTTKIIKKEGKQITHNTGGL